jgi:hypothetical protein
MEDKLLMDRYEAIGPKWAQLATYFDGRTDIDLKNRYNRIQRVRSRVQKEERRDQMERTANDIQKIVGNSGRNSGRPKFPSLAPGTDFMGMKMGGAVPPKRIICSRINGKKGTESGD